jgi:hypothetical protein
MAAYSLVFITIKAIIVATLSTMKANYLILKADQMCFIATKVAVMEIN